MVVLDTHAWLWWLDSPELLSGAASREIESAESIGISAVSCWELGMLAAKRRIELDPDPSSWVRRALGQAGVVPIPIDSRVATEAALLDLRVFPPDPADRMIYSTARSTGSILVTKDRRIRDFDPRGTLW